MITDDLVKDARTAFIGQWGGVLPFDTASLDRDMRAALEAVAPAIRDVALLDACQRGEVFTLGKLHDLVSAAHARAYREGQEAMRERAAATAERRAAMHETPLDQDDDAAAEGRAIAAAIRALPGEEEPTP